LKSLRRVSDRIPTAAWYNIAFAFIEAFAYSGSTFIFQNYIQFPSPKHPGDQPGALGKGQQTATAWSTFFQFWSWGTPLIAAIIADRYLIKFYTIIVFSFIFISGLLILTVTSTPAAIKAGVAYPGLIVGIIVTGLGDGLQSVSLVMVGEQYPRKKKFIRTLGTGEKVVVDPQLTLSSIYHYLYFTLAIGYLAPTITTNIEKYHSFWLAFLIMALVFSIGIVLYSWSRRWFIETKTSGLQLWKSILVIRMAIARGFNFENTKPSKIPQREHEHSNIIWDDKFVEELRTTIQASKVLLFLSIYWMCYGQMSSNLISQAATMETGIFPNDMMSQIDYVALIILIPFMDKVFYPMLRRRHMEPSPITRIFIGFMLITVAMSFAAILQHIIYLMPPCYQFPRCDIESGGSKVPNYISVWWQAPIYVIVAFSEAITSLDYAYSKSPPSMKSLVMAINLLTSSIGAALALAFVPLARDPLLPYMFSGMGEKVVVDPQLTLSSKLYKFYI
ncbi:7452_t:CDS:2, partial [Ambispora leptoticha]